MRNCNYCGREYIAKNYNQKYCSPSCKNCASSRDRMKEKDFRQFKTISSFYATEAGRKEVEKGSHKDYLARLNMTRDEWLAEWDQSCNITPRTIPVLYVNKEDEKFGVTEQWTVEQILSYINEDRSPDWTDYTKDDWVEGWEHWVEPEGNYFIHPNFLQQ